MPKYKLPVFFLAELPNDIMAQMVAQGLRVTVEKQLTEIAGPAKDALGKLIGEINLEVEWGKVERVL